MKLHHLIQNNFFGNAEDYARAIHVSRSGLFGYLEELRIMGAILEYNKKKMCFEYKNNFDIKLSVYIKHD